MFTRLRAARHDDGFTLIELLIVIIILGILAAIVIFAVGGLSGQGTKSACRTDGKSIDTADEAYYAKNGSYPGSLLVLQSGKILKDLPNTDKNSGSYWIKFTPGSPPDVVGYVKGFLDASHECYPVVGAAVS